MFSYLEKLKNMEYIPDSILDIGAHYGNWTSNMLLIYPNAKYYLFECIDYQQLNNLKNNPNIYIKNVVLNDKIEEVDWFEEKNTGDSFFKEKSKFFINTKPIKKKTIDLNTLIQNDNILSDAKNIFIKIDCQGAEIPILKGASQILHKTDFIVLEIPFFGQYNEGVPNFLEHIQFMNSIGFIPFDIIDKHYIYNFNMQIDMLFINKNHKFNNIVQTNLY